MWVYISTSLYIHVQMSMCAWGTRERAWCTGSVTCALFQRVRACAILKRNGRALHGNCQIVAFEFGTWIIFIFIFLESSFREKNEPCANLITRNGLSGTHDKWQNVVIEFGTWIIFFFLKVSQSRDWLFYMATVKL